MRIPRQFLIKGKRWTVRRTKDLKDENEEPCSGLTDVTNRVIELDKSLTGDDLEWVFWHEYGHAFLYEAGVTGNTGGLSDLAEEIVCDNFADVMTTDKTVKFKRGRRK